MLILFDKRAVYESDTKTETFYFTKWNDDDHISITVTVSLLLKE